MTSQFSRPCPANSGLGNLTMCHRTECIRGCTKTVTCAEPAWRGPYAPSGPNTGSPSGVWDQRPKGCICPPTSEMTCQRPDCGRKAQQVVTRAYTASSGGVAS